MAVIDREAPSRQIVVRTYPHGWINETQELQKILDKGYHVVMCNCVGVVNGGNILEYIVEYGGNRAECY